MSNLWGNLNYWQAAVIFITNEVGINSQPTRGSGCPWPCSENISHHWHGIAQPIHGLHTSADVPQIPTRGQHRGLWQSARWKALGVHLCLRLHHKLESLQRLGSHYNEHRHQHNLGAPRLHCHLNRNCLPRMLAGIRAENYAFCLLPRLALHRVYCGCSDDPHASPRT
jgi:hypothetical protein